MTTNRPALIYYPEKAVCRASESLLKKIKDNNKEHMFELIDYRSLDKLDDSINRLPVCIFDGNRVVYGKDLFDEIDRMINEPIASNKTRGDELETKYSQNLGVPFHGDNTFVGVPKFDESTIKPLDQLLSERSR